MPRDGPPITQRTSGLVDTTLPICGNAAQRPQGMISDDGQKNIVDSAEYPLQYGVRPVKQATQLKLVRRGAYYISSHQGMAAVNAPTVVPRSCRAVSGDLPGRAAS
jgi:hypothetical protein